MTTKDIARIALDAQALALAAENLKPVVKKKKVDAGDMVKLGTTNIVGVEMLKAQGTAIESL